MNTFSEYEKIPQNFKSLNLDKKDWNKLDKLDWIVTEKIHGANFSFIYQNRTLKFAKRKEHLAWTDDFFAFQTVVNRIESQVISLFEQLSMDILADKYIIYGELFGGAYPHLSVPAAPHVHAIQTGVFYSPDVNFCAFDIAFETQKDNHPEKSYLDYKKSIHYFEKHRLLYAKPLFIGKLGEALAFNTRIDSTIPSLLNLPALANNLIEGVVVKPVHNPHQQAAEHRPIIKIKNKEFNEREEFHQANKWSYLPDNTFSHSSELDFLVTDIQSYITQNRFDNILSKTGRLDVKNPDRLNAIREEFLRDVLEDFDDNNNQILAELSMEQRQWLSDRTKARIEVFLQKAT